MDIGSPSTGLALVRDAWTTRLKWHRLRRSLADPEFSTEVLADGLARGASMELDLQVRVDGGFAVMHDATLDRETMATGPVRERSAADLAEVTYRESRTPLLLSEGLAALLRAAHPDALLQFDMKNSLAEIGAAGVEHLAGLFSNAPGNLIFSGDSLELIAMIGDCLPGARRGIDPTDRLVELWRRSGPAAMEAALLAELHGPAAPHMVYLAWELVLEAKAAGPDLIGLCHAEGVEVDAWTYTLKEPSKGFSDAEWPQFAALMALRPDQITTDEAVATEVAWRARWQGGRQP